MKELSEYIYRFRFILSLLLFVICVIFELHGSSITMWNDFVQPGLNDSKYAYPVIGKERPIRTDEWALHTPMAFSQKFENYPLENSIWRAEKTNMAVVYNQPVKKSLSIAVKPFYWGYFLFGTAKGLSWFWCGRMIALFLIMFEFFQLITRRNRLLSLTGAVLTVFSPGIQWWFAINDLVEMICWGALAVIITYYFPRSGVLWKKLLLSCLFGLCIAGYLLCFYPAWQIPFAYTFAVCIIWAAAENFKFMPHSRRDIIYIVFPVLIAAAIVLSVIIPSTECLEIVRNTVYPGQRFCLGGTYFHALFLYIYNSNIITFTNICEISHFIGLFPLPAILSVIYLVRSKFKDKLILGLLCVQIFFFLFLTFGFPSFLVKTLLLFPVTDRAVMATAFIDIILLLRLFGVNFGITEQKYKLLISSCYCLIVCAGVYFVRCMELKDGSISDNFNIYSCMAVIVLFVVSYAVMSVSADYSKKRVYFLSSCIILSVVIFGQVNPLMKGIDAVYEIPAAKVIQKIQKENPGRWLVAGSYPVTNFPAMMGAPTVNSTNIYPNLKLWKTLDPAGEYINEYNRYAHMPLMIFYPKGENYKTGFESPHDDLCIVYLSVFDLYKTDVSYVLSTFELKRFIPFNIKEINNPEKSQDKGNKQNDDTAALNNRYTNGGDTAAEYNPKLIKIYEESGIYIYKVEWN